MLILSNFILVVCHKGFLIPVINQQNISLYQLCLSFHDILDKFQIVIVFFERQKADCISDTQYISFAFSCILFCSIKCNSFISSSINIDIFLAQSV